MKEKMILNEIGKTAEGFWKEIPNHFQNVELDYFIIMPNHLHGIIIINCTRRDVACNVSTIQNNISPMQNISPKKGSLAVIIRSFKSAVAKAVHESGLKHFAWQLRFYDRIIRNEKELYNIRRYIKQNPLRWELDKDKPENICEL